MAWLQDKTTAEMDFEGLRDEQGMKTRQAVSDLWANYLNSLGLHFLNTRLNILSPVVLRIKKCGMKLPSSWHIGGSHFMVAQKIKMRLRCMN